MALNVYSWEYIHRYFPPEVVEQYRKQIINEWKPKLFKDKEKIVEMAKGFEPNEEQRGVFGCGDASKEIVNGVKHA